jgi:NAD+ diphosphatase
MRTRRSDTARNVVTQRDAKIQAMADHYEPAVRPPDECDEPALWFAFHKSELLIAQVSDDFPLPHCRDLAELGLSSVRRLYLGTYAGRHCYVSELAHADTLPAGHALQGLRVVLGGDPALGMLAGRAFQIMEWDRNHQYCSRCSTPTEVRRDERARVCPSCGYTAYPPISPAIMILIVRGREILLARKKEWAPGRFSALAGFVEPGEELEDTVRRETREEVGLEIKNLRYFGSQPWPFPHQLMIAFTADYASGEVTPDGVEIEEAAFFDIGKLPDLPAGISISRRMIDAVCAKLARGEKL